jgi:hypothetical protein
MALHSQQSHLLMASAGSPAFAEVEEVTSITGPDGSANLIDVTHLRSTAKEYLQGIPDWGKLSLDCNFTAETQQMALRDMYRNQAVAKAFELMIPDDAGGYHQFAFDAVCLSWQLASPTDGKVGLTISLQITGDMVYTAP